MAERPRMCDATPCGELACFRVQIEDVSQYFCLKHGQQAKQNLPYMRDQLKQHEHNASCRCGSTAVCQVEFGGQWVNNCRACGEKVVRNLTIIRSGNAPRVRPLKTHFAAAPTILIEELPIPNSEP